MTVARYAVYWAPPRRHPLWAAGCAWLGRDAHDGEPLTPSARPEVVAPWRYGFHATLKAPLQLAPGASVHDWLSSLRALATRHAPFAMPPLRVAVLSDFIALRPVHDPTADHPLRRLADDCVDSLDRWRAPMAAVERQRQLRAAKSERQRAQVDSHGYAHVFDDWHLHLTLSNNLGGEAADKVASLLQVAERHFAPALALPLLCDALCVFVEPGPQQPFVLCHRFALGAPAT